MRVHCFLPIACIALFAAHADAGAVTAPAPRWHHPLYAGGGGYWQKRIPIAITNKLGREAAGDPLTLAIGSGPGEADLAGSRAEAVRLCTAAGTELLFRITNRQGILVDRGPIPAASRLTIPAEGPAGSSTTYHLYFENPEAWPIPDFLAAAGELTNGGVEMGEGEAPFGWLHDPPDGEHRAAWVNERPRSGARCLKTVVAGGAAPTWVSTRQRGIALQGGAEYVMRAWVKAEGVEGSAGWYVHVGNAANSMLLAPMLSGGGGSYGWKEVSTTFRAPPEATVADLGTVLWGTGTAWFDDVSLSCATEALLAAKAGPVETIELRRIEVGAGATAPARPPTARYEVPITAMNFEAEDVRDQLILADLSPILVRARLRNEALVVAPSTTGGPRFCLRDAVLLAAELPPSSIVTYPLELAAGTENPAEAIESYAELLASRFNRVADPSFEEGKAAGSGAGGWVSGETPAGVSVERADGGLFGARSGRIRFPATTERAWTGWRQDVAVEPGATYLHAAWVKCENVESGDVLLHAHLRTESGDLCRSQGFASSGSALTGTKDWTLLAGFLTMPDDAATLQIHLTMLASGTVWHDGVVVARVTRGVPGKLRGAADAARELSVWQVDAVVKVFRDDVPPSAAAKPHIALARNEKEPLQLAIRSREAIEDVAMEVDSPRTKQGATLAGAAIGVVGYVPIDHATNYYRSDSPAWHRKLPQSEGACDGRPGWWPDPLLPRTTFGLEADSTQPIWITVAAPNDAAAGDYEGRVRLKAAGRTLAETPFTVRVWDFALPDATHVGAVYDVRLSGDWIEPGKSRDETRRAFWKFMAERRLCADRVQPDPALRFEDGRAVADFGAYDEAATYYFDTLKFPFSYTPHVFYLFGWGHPPSEKFGEKPYEGTYPYAGVDRTKLRPAFKGAYQACLAAYWNHLKEKGWDKKCLLYIADEPFDSQAPIRDQMQALCAMIHEVDPAIPIYSSTWHHQPAWDGYITVWGIGHYGVVPPQTFDAIRRRGARLWFTTDGHMCTDTPLAAIERLLPHYCFAFGVEAYEFWGIDWLTYNPFEFGWHAFIHQSEEPGKETYVRYPNGDGFLAYPGKLIGGSGPVSSIRLEQAREGVEDYEYFYLLRELMAKARAAGIESSPAAAALAAAGRLVAIPNAGGRYASRILPDPAALYAAREGVARAIEDVRRKLGE